MAWQDVNDYSAMLAQLGAPTAADVPPADSVLPLTRRARAEAARRRQAELEAAPVDMAAYQEFAKRQAEMGKSALFNALAAQFAGQRFQPLQAHFLKQAAAAQAPMKLGRGMITPDGKFLDDPFAQREAQVKRLSMQAQLDETAADRMDALEAARKEQARRDAEARDFRREMAANRGAGQQRAPAGYQWSTTPDGQAALTFIPGGPADPANKAMGQPTEDERKAAGWFFQADTARRNMESALRKSPTASMPTVAERGLGMIPGVGEDIANAMRPEARQQFVQAASSFAEATLRAATGAGVNKDEAMQKVRELTPQIGDKPAVVQQKLAAQQMYLDSLRLRANRAMPPGAAPAKGGAEADPLGLRR